MSELVKGGETIEESRVDEPAVQVLTYEERLRIAERVVAALRADGFDCERADEAPTH